MMVLILLATPAVANGIDPTAPPSWSAPVVKQTQATGALESIMIQGRHKQAIIGGKVFREGEVWGQHRIRTITRDQVMLSNGRSLRLFPQVSELSQEH
ncbi:hypothetical protein [uncultured Ferrimonas sp.]|uniref:hypothetical protein n=1 Tax=uncultured Ferrimonas sp. TaxID=432640 RepID=UPI00260EBE7D|nr:hypothetical protein [uncultured Ferrimonas sp.]